MASTSRLARVAFVTLVAVAAVLSFADRAPDLVFRAVASLGGSVADAVGIDPFDGRGLPVEYDVVGHVVLWSALAAASWWTFRKRIPAVVQAFALFVASSAAEIGQAYLTTTRVPEPRDLVANAIGIAGGLAFALAIEAAVMLTRRTSVGASTE